ERKLGQYQLLSTQWQYQQSEEYAETYGRTDDYLNGVKIDAVHLIQKGHSPSARMTGNLFYSFTADSSATKFDAQVNYARYRSNQNGYQLNEYINGSSWRLNGENLTLYEI